jgi:hypothetical protein
VTARARSSAVGLAIAAVATGAGLLGAGLSGAATLSACDRDERRPPPEPSAAPPNPSSVVDTLGIDAGLLGEAVDPPAPAGDLKAEIERFTTLDACVAERAKLDPLVGDALRAIGYDTFLRDACRQLEAAHDRTRDACEKIDSSALKKQCRSWVARIGQTPDGCPLDVEGAPSRGRSPTCVAVAGKDPRLCAGEPRTAARATCEALVYRDEKKCDVLLPTDRPACKRELARWRPLLAAPLEGLPKLPARRGKLTIHGADGTKDPSSPETDLAADYARGAVVVTGRSRRRFELGSVGEVDALRIGGGLVRKPRVGVAIILESSPLSPKDEAKPSLDRFDLEIPGELPLSCGPGEGGETTAKCELRVVSARADEARAGEIALALEGTVSSGGRSYQVKLDAATFVRDVVAEDPSTGRRLIPPAHPALGGAGAFGSDAHGHGLGHGLAPGLGSAPAPGLGRLGAPAAGSVDAGPR